MEDGKTKHIISVLAGVVLALFLATIGAVVGSVWTVYYIACQPRIINETCVKPNEPKKDSTRYFWFSFKFRTASGEEREGNSTWWKSDGLMPTELEIKEAALSYYKNTTSFEILSIYEFKNKQDEQNFISGRDSLAKGDNAYGSIRKLKNLFDDKGLIELMDSTMDLKLIDSERIKITKGIHPW